MALVLRPLHLKLGIYIYICIYIYALENWDISGLDNGLALVWIQAIIESNDNLPLLRQWWIAFNKTLSALIVGLRPTNERWCYLIERFFKMYMILFKKMLLDFSYARFPPFWSRRRSDFTCVWEWLPTKDKCTFVSLNICWNLWYLYLLFCMSWINLMCFGNGSEHNDWYITYLFY